jgi:hypothetical protein
VLVAGGLATTPEDVLAGAELYRPATAKWTVTGSMTTTRYGHTAVLLPSGEVLVAGGTVAVNQGEFGNTYVYTAAAEVYNESVKRSGVGAGVSLER